MKSKKNALFYFGNGLLSMKKKREESLIYFTYVTNVFNHFLLLTMNLTAMFGFQKNLRENASKGYEEETKQS